MKKRKKGSWFVDNLGHLILMAICLGIGIYMVWAYILHGPSSSIDSAQKCGALTLNSGTCKETCDLSIEFELPDVGCEGVANKCCVIKDENMRDLLLPSGYGGDTRYDFEVISIELGTPPAGCRADVNNPRAAMSCTPGRAYTMPIVITIRNTGTSAMTGRVYADPLVVINGNGDNIRGPGRYNTGTGSTLAVGGTARLNANVAATASDAKLNDYWDIYPYASCVDRICRDTDSNSRGILSTNSDVYVTVKFVNP
ncbi:MAG: hypothetical protein ACP5NW_02565 [Candidatus Woesearchaeota archaeon]